MKKSSLALGLAVSLLMSPVVLNPSSAAGIQSFWATAATATTEYGGYGASLVTGVADATSCGDVSGQAWTYSSPYTNSALTATYEQAVALESVDLYFSNDLKDTVQVEVANGPSGSFTVIGTISSNYFCNSNADSVFTNNIIVKVPVTGGIVADRVRLTILTENDWPEVDAIAFVGTTPSALVKTKNPTVTGISKVSKVLTANVFASTWTGSPTFTYNWYSCSASGTNTPSVKPANCNLISGATSNKFTLKSAQKGKFIRVRVLARNTLGSMVVFSKTTVKVS